MTGGCSRRRSWSGISSRCRISTSFSCNFIPFSYVTRWSWCTEQVRMRLAERARERLSSRGRLRDRQRFQLDGLRLEAGAGLFRHLRREIAEDLRGFAELSFAREGVGPVDVDLQEELACVVSLCG